MPSRIEPHAQFWGLADEYLVRAGVTRSMMMGFPCLRVDGKIFACCDRETGDLVVKLPEARVDALLAGERAQPFTPSGRRFREWASIPQRRSRTWPRLLDEALAFVADRPAPEQRRR